MNDRLLARLDTGELRLVDRLTSRVARCLVEQSKCSTDMFHACNAGDVLAFGMAKTQLSAAREATKSAQAARQIVLEELAIESASRRLPPHRGLLGENLAGKGEPAG